MTRRGKTLAGDLEALQEAILGLWDTLLAVTRENILYLAASIVITLPVIIALVLWTNPK